VRGELCAPSWARLLKRIFDLDLEHCPNCRGELKIIAAAEAVMKMVCTPFPLRLRRVARSEIGPTFALMSSRSLAELAELVLRALRTAGVE
jgi:hypothetical protein